MRRTLKITAAVLTSASLLGTSTMAAAAVPAATAPTAQMQSQAPDAWLMLSAMSSTRSIALGGTAAAAQPGDVPLPPPPYAAAPVINGEIIGVLVWFALIAIALGISGPSGRPNSPP